MPGSNTPTDPREPRHGRFLRIGFRLVSDVAICIQRYYGAETASGGAVLPLAYMFPCVRFIIDVTANNATLGTGGWLYLTRSGLSPNKRRPAFPGALTKNANRKNKGGDRPALNRPHDKLFKFVFGISEYAADMLINNLPTELTEELDWESMELEPGSQVNQELAESFTDLRFRIKLRKKLALIYILLEHKSYTDQLAAWQILKNMVECWDKDQKDNKNFRLIIPVLFYHGQENWEFRRFNSLFPDAPESMKRFIPEFDTVILDLSTRAENEIKGAAIPAIAQKIMKAASAGDEEGMLRGLCLLTEQNLEPGWYSAFIKYILSVSDISILRLLRIMWRRNIKTGAKEIMTTAEKLINSGIKKGRERGEIDGALNTIQAFLSAGVDWDTITKATGYTQERFEKEFNERSS